MIKYCIRGWTRWLISIIPAIKKEEIGRITVHGQSRQKVSRTPISINNLSVIAYATHPRYTGDVNRKITSRMAWPKT
jgi:hypothetical protein